MDTELSILQISDLHILADSQQKMLGLNTELCFLQVLEKACNELNSIDLLLLTGDLAQNPSSSTYQRILKIVEKQGIPCYCLPGNHDDYRLMQQVFKQGIIHCNKQVLLKNWQILNLNSQIIGKEGGELSRQELQFLQKTLAQTSEYHTLIAIHHHCLASGSQWLDKMRITNSQEFLTLLQQYPQVKAIIHGHIHQQFEATSHNIKIFGTPSSCFQFKPNSQQFAIDNTPAGYRFIKLYSDGKIESQVQRLLTQNQPLELSSNGY